MSLLRRLRGSRIVSQVPKSRRFAVESLERRDAMSAVPNAMISPLAEPASGAIAHYIFYNQSAWDGDSSAIEPAKDSLAIVPGKAPYVPGGGTAVGANVTNFSRGITGIMVDLPTGTNHTGIVASDFQFKVGNNNTPSAWAAAPAPTAISVIAGGGVGGSDRVEITWAAGAIKNQWLEVRVLATPHTGLAAADVHYWGNKVADSGSGSPANTFDTTSTDLSQVYAAVGGAKPIDNALDYNRDGKVSSTDGAVALANIGSITRLNIPTPTSVPGLSGPIGPQQGVTMPVGAIVLSASSGTATNQSLLDSAPAGSTFYFTAGTYQDLSIDTRPGNKYVGAFGAILTSASQAYAFAGNGTATKPVVVSNLTINGYAPAYQGAAIQGGDYWRIDHVDVLNSTTGGVLIGSHSSLTDSYVHDNGQLGIKAYSTENDCTDVLLNNVRVSHNNPANAYDFQIEAGGSKFWNVHGLTITHCEFDNNVGDGIWMDGNLAGGGSSNITIADNWTHDNGRYGIFQEIGGQATITNNLSENNGMSGLKRTDGQNADGAGIQIDNSESVTISNNTIRNNYNGIVLQSYTRADTAHRARNLVVTNNSITMTRGITGVIDDTSLVSAITFDYNVYRFSGSAKFAWGSDWNRSWSQWRAAGFDLHSTMT